MNFLFILMMIWNTGVPEAAIRIIKGGGGYGEMQALSALERLDQLIQPCLQYPKECGVTTSQVSFLRTARDQGQMQTQSARLTFFPGSEGLPGGYDPANDLYILMGSKLLYQDDEQPRPWNEIAAVVMTSCLMRPSLETLRTQFQLDEEQITEIALRVFRSTQAREQSASLSEQETLHALMIQTGPQREVLFSIERENGTTDVTASVVAQLNCRNRTADRVLSVKGLHSEDGQYVARAVWACGDEVYEGRTIMQAQDEQIFVRALNVQPACENKLKGSK